MFWTVTQSLLTGLATTFEIFILTLIFALAAWAGAGIWPAQQV